MRKVILGIVLMCLFISGCAAKIAQEIPISVQLRTTTEQEIVTQLGTPDNFLTNFEPDGKVSRTLIYYAHAWQGKYYRMNACNEQGKCLEKIIAPQGKGSGTMIFRFVDDALVEAR